MTSFSARRRARRHRPAPTGELQLAAMVDMMINLLLFLLNLYGNTSVSVSPSEDLKFALSTEVRPVRFAAMVIVSRAAVTVGGVEVGTWTAEGRAPNQAELQAMAEAYDALPRPLEPDDSSEVLLQVDRRVDWVSLSPVIDAAAGAGFANVRFVVSSTSDPLAQP